MRFLVLQKSNSTPPAPLSTDGVNARLKGIGQKIDFAAALAGKCLLLSSKDGCPCPRLIWAEEDMPSTAQPQSGRRYGHFCRVRWLKRGKTSATRFRVRFLCAYDYTPVACGADGNGYVLEHNDWRRWLQKCLPVLKVRTSQFRVGLPWRSGLNICTFLFQ